MTINSILKYEITTHWLWMLTHQITTFPCGTGILIQERKRKKKLYYLNYTRKECEINIAMILLLPANRGSLLFLSHPGPEISMELHHPTGVLHTCRCSPTKWSSNFSGYYAPKVIIFEQALVGGEALHLVWLGSTDKIVFSMNGSKYSSRGLWHLPVSTHSNSEKLEF